MASKPKAAADTGPIDIIRIEQGVVEVFLLGVSPLIMNKMSRKASEQLLFPSARKNEAEKRISMKHAPLEEFRGSVHRTMGDTETRLTMPSPAFKGSMLTAALRTPGVTKTEVGQLIWVEGDYVPIYGVPALHMAIVRMADISRTPDVRTRAILPEWCCKLRVRYTMPLISASTVVNLLAGGGFLAGVGDFRQEKGKGSFGQFELVDQDDERWHRIAANQGRVVQDAALANPVAYDLEAEELLGWFANEVKVRGRGADAPVAAAPLERKTAAAAKLLKPKAKLNGNGAHA